MIVRLISHDFVRQSARFAFGKATAVAIACALLGAAANAATIDAAASASAAASAPAAASETVPLSGTQYTVKAGQSLNDVAIDVTQSHDRSVLARAAKALFDANPKAFMGGDPSRMRVGAVLNVPSLDATGNVAASGAEAVGAASGVAASTAAAASAVVPASSVAAQTGGASASATTTAQAASNPGAASAAVPASAGATGQHGWTGAIQQSASVPGETLASESGASVPAVAMAPAASSAQPHVSSLQQLLALKNRVLMALQAHGFGPAHPEASHRAPAAGASVSTGQQTLAASGASGAVAAAVTPEVVSRPAEVAAPHVAGGELIFNGWEINIGALSAAVAALLVLIVGWFMRSRKRAAAAAAAAAAAEERIEKRVRAAADSTDSAPAEKPAAEQAADEASTDVTISQQGRDASHDAATTLSDEAAEAEYIATLKESPNSKGALMGLVGIYAERRDVARFADVAQRVWHLSGGRGPNWRHVASLGRQLDAHNPLYAEAGAAPGANLAPLESSGGGMASVDVPEKAPADAHDGAAAADASGVTGESGAKPVTGAVDSAQAGEPLAEAKEADAGADGAQIEPPSATAQAEEAAPGEQEAVPPTVHAEAEIPHDAQAAPQAEEPTPAATEESTPSTADAAPHAADAESRANDAASRTHAIAARLEAMAAQVEAAKSRESETAPHGEAATSPAPELTWPHDEPDTHAGEVPPALTDAFAPPPPFPSEAISALNSLDLSLPPRLETEPAEPLRASHDDIAVPSPVSLTTQPVVAPEITEQQAVPPFVPEPPHAADAIEAGIAGSASVAGLGAARFGALNLNFDLDLPASTSPLPTFTPEELAKIARNKLDLAAEYIELGDIAGARTLINEVIESNDAATRNDARAMLSTLAPLS
ncbi:hypothetical protein FAZ95_37700 [Trinickia violacea]|uniref:Fimbrial protein FimV n=1 Tax=Trinickia violacea TaxID=2571746 RepID=A0A4P8J1B2_9BURK|nr:FimV/HubP family polar landmark protein [Trinickia violacea]QCP54607.1 hypothetical protein FAZ95_37700 [Trinickia violacea]